MARPKAGQQRQQRQSNQKAFSKKKYRLRRSIDVIITRLNFIFWYQMRRYIVEQELLMEPENVDLKFWD